MPYTVQQENTYPQSVADLNKAVLGAIEGLEGKILKNEPDSGRITVKFNKTILGNVLGDRTQMELEMMDFSQGGSKLSLTVFPINPVGQKLQFGARKGVSRKVMSWFIAHVEHRLGKD